MTDIGVDLRNTSRKSVARLSVPGLLALLLVIPAGRAWAQVAPVLTPGALPRLVPEPPAGSPLPRVLPPTPPSVAPGLPVPAAPLPPPLSGAQVQVTATELRGATVYPAARFADLLASLHGMVDQTRIEAVRQQILAVYRGDGYVFTAISTALDPAGRLLFRVTEGRIVDVKLDGNIGPAGKQVLRFLNHLTEANPIDIATLERWLLLAQDVPGITLRTVLRPSTGDPGALSLVAQVSRTKFSGLATADNRGYSATGPEEFLTSVGGNSFSEYGERTDATFFYTARSTELFGQVSTELFLGSSGLKLRVYGGKGTTDPTGSLGQLGYHGDTFVAGTSLSYPVIRRRQETLSVAAYFDVMESSIDTGTNGESVLASRDNLRVVRLGADYAKQDSWLGLSRGAVNIASLRLSQGVPEMGASRQGDQLAGRLNERIDFTKIAMEATRTQTLFSPWRDATVALQGLVAGQYSGDVLPSSEKFFLGGLRFDRGFYSGEITGDKAFTAAMELQLNTHFVVPWLTAPFDLGAQFYGFYDWGETWESQKTDPNRKLTSTGGGVRLSFPRAIEVDLEGVARLTRRPQGIAANVPALTPSGFYWRVLSRF